MKRSWIGLALLLVLLISGLLVTWAMDAIHDPISDALERAAAQLMLGDWESADQTFRAAKSSWEKWAHFRTCFADHSPVEEIDAGFAELEVYCTARENVAFAAACAKLSKQVAAVGEAHGLVWWNIL